MRIEKFDYNDIDDLFANTYLVSDENNDAIIIDPSVDNDRLISFIIAHKYNLKAVLLTHGHFDHIRGVNRLLKEFEVPLYIHEYDKEFLTNSYLNCSISEGKEIMINKDPILLHDNDILSLLKERIRVIHTPFHTKGSVCFYIEDCGALFSGDTLFKFSIGRDDLPGSDPRSVYASLEKLKKLDENTKVYPGHGPNTVLKTEFMLNRFLLK